MPTTFEVISLGVLARLDPTQGNEINEGAANLLGTYGSAGSPLHRSIVTLSANILSEDDNTTYDVDNGGGFDSFRINGGAPQNFDGVAEYTATITYIDGTTAVITATIFQDVNGNTYLAPETALGADQTALVQKPIQSLSLTAVVSNTGDMVANRIAGDFKSAVEGTAGNDSMTVGYIDGQGDAITANADWISAGDGNDTVNGGGGDDSILGGFGSDRIDGGTGNDQIFGGDGADTVDASSGNDTVSLEGGNDVYFQSDIAGAVTVDGGAGTDLLDFTNGPSSTGATVTIGAGGQGSFTHSTTGTTGVFTDFETISGSAFNDTLNGGANTQSMSLFGEGGSDVLSGGSAADTLLGGAGNDSAAGGGGNDRVEGNDGDDVLSGDLTAATIVNGGFDSGLTDWTGTDLEVNPENAYRGNGSTNNVVEMDGEPGFTTVLQQSFTVGTPGIGRIAVDSTLRTAGGAATAGVDGFTVQVLNSGGFVIASTTVLPTTAAAWTTFTLDVNFAASGTYTLRFTEVGNNDSFGALLDNVRFITAAGADTLDGGLGNDTLYGGDGNDSLAGGDGNDSLIGGLGNDTIFSGFGNDSSFGGDGDDLFDDVAFTLAWTGSKLIDGGAGNDFSWDAAGNDTFFGGDGNDTFLGDSTGDDQLFGGAGSDLLSGGTGNDALQGGDGNDTLVGGDGIDALQGGDGNDILDGAAGVDTLTGGAGADVFTADGTADLITDFNATAGIGDGNSTNNDFVNLSAFYNSATLAAWNAANPSQTFGNALAWARFDQQDGTLNQAGGLRLQGVAANNMSAENTAIVCFAQGTLIRTARGDLPVETLRPGDLVQTLDNGMQRLLWTASRRLSGRDLRDNPRLRPIRLRRGALAGDAQGADLLLSPQHRVLLSSRAARRLTGGDAVLVAAVRLTDLPGVERVADCAPVTYHHLMFERHEIVLSNGVPTESLYLGAQARLALGDRWQEIEALFPELLPAGREPLACRRIVEAKQARQLVAHHRRRAATAHGQGLLLIA